MKISVHQPALSETPAARPALAPGALATPALVATPVATSGLSGLARGGVPLWLPLPFLVRQARSGRHAMAPSSAGGRCR